MEMDGKLLIMYLVMKFLIQVIFIPMISLIFFENYKYDLNNNYNNMKNMNKF